MVLVPQQTTLFLAWADVFVLAYFYQTQPANHLPSLAREKAIELESYSKYARSSPRQAWITLATVKTPSFTLDCKKVRDSKIAKEIHLFPETWNQPADSFLSAPNITKWYQVLLVNSQRWKLQNCLIFYFFFYPLMRNLYPAEKEQLSKDSLSGNKRLYAFLKGLGRTGWRQVRQRAVREVPQINTYVCVCFCGCVTYTLNSLHVVQGVLVLVGVIYYIIL